MSPQPQPPMKLDNDKLPPHDLDAERAVLGSMMISQHAAEYARDNLKSVDFYDDRHRKLFNALSEMAREGIPGELVLVKQKLKKMSVPLDAVDGQPYISVCMNQFNSAENIEHFVNVVKDLSSRRRDILALHATEIAAYDLSDGDYRRHLGPLSDSTPEAPERPTLETVSAADLQVMEFPPPTFAVQNLLPAGLCFFAGAYKSGKSWMVLGLAVAVARGDDFFDEHTTQGEVLFVGIEDSSRRLHRRLSSLSKDGWPDSLHLATRMPRLDDGGIEALEDFVDAHPDTRLVIIDVWARVRGRERSRNMYTDDYAALEIVQSFASDRDIAVLVVHHHRKAPDDKDPFNRFSGSTGIGGGADALWSLERERGQCNASFITTGRDIREVELALDFNEETGAWTALGPLSEYTQSHERLQIKQVIRDAGGSPVSPKEMSEALDNKNVSTIRNLLRKMLDAGEVEKESHGKYVLKENVDFIDFQRDKE